MKLHFQFEECHNEELINFIKTIKSRDEVSNYLDNHDVAVDEIYDAFYTVYGEDFVCERKWNDYLWDEVYEWLVDAIEETLSN